ncbi:sensor histidine kinase [Halorientalis litorea]|uniref:sensor histidine kinase n=1 Tax=Halorientalis litorea TaxID=2931977 RepID=UPI001FF107F4|nr:histidine kinase N-terminal 7TM domain-containing protein [Halorientalis litorea]
MLGGPVEFVYAGLPILTVLVGSVVLYWIRSRFWDARGAKWYTATLLVGGVWMLALAGYVLATDPTRQRQLAVLARTFGILSLVVWSLFLSRYTGTQLHRRRWFRALAALASVSFPVLAVTNGFHGLLYTGWVQASTPFPHTFGVFGPAYAAVVALVAAVNGYAFFVLVRYLLSTPNQSDVRITAVVLAGLSIPVAELLGVAGVFPADGIGHAGYGALPFVTLATVGLFRFSLLDVRPVARNTVIGDLRDPVLVLDGDSRVVDFNRASSRIWSGLETHVGDPFETVCPTLAERLTLPDGEASTSAQVVLSVDGSDRHFSVTVSRTEQATNGVGWYSVLLRDVTELERSRWQLEKQNDRLDQVASTISHDLRNPINVADGNTELLRTMIDDDGIPPERVADAADKLAKTRETHERMEEIIDDVLTIAREGKTVEDTERLSLVAVAREAWGNVGTGDAALTITGDRTLRAERSKLLRIFENLFRNSVEHGSTGSQNSGRSDDSVDHGPAEVTVEVGPTPDGFFVTDDGPGIPESHHENVFEYGYTTTDQGTGLGLSIVRTMAESHGWTVELDDSHDGTRFVFDTSGESRSADARDESAAP